MYSPSEFLKGLATEEYSSFAGVNETVSEKKMVSSKGVLTDQADGVSFRSGNLASDGFGFGRLPFPPSVANPYQSGGCRGFGFFQSPYAVNGNKEIFALFTALRTSDGAKTWSLDKWYMDDSGGAGSIFPAPSNIASYSPSTTAALLTQAPLNGVHALADRDRFYRFKPAGTNVYAPVLVQPPAIVSLTPGAGSLNNYYAYCYTLADDNNNESLPSVLFATGNLASNNITVDLNLAGLEAAAQGWTKIRLWRTLVSPSIAVAASANPVFYFVSVTNITASATYSIVDNALDTTLSLAPGPAGTGVFKLALGGVDTDQNLFTYFNGALQALSTTAVPKYVTAFAGRLIASNWMNVGGVDQPSRTYWNDLSDSLQNNQGSAGSWNALSYIDDQTKRPVIGQYAGLQGRFYIFRVNGTTLLQQTGVASNPFIPAELDNDYGFYHHSVADMGNSIIGRTRDGIAIFNGTTYDHISDSIKSFMQTCVVPEGDSGVYDFATQRYYLAVCTNKAAFDFALYQDNVQPAFRNAVIVYDRPTKTWEIHMNSPIQYFAKLKDDFGKEKIFGVGVNSDIFTIGFSDIYGTCISYIGLAAGAGAVASFIGTVVVLPSALVGKKLSMPIMYSGGKMIFSEMETTISSIASSPATIGIVDPLILNGSDVRVIYQIQNGFGSVTSVIPTLTIEDTNNHFQSQMNYSSLVKIANGQPGSSDIMAGMFASRSTDSRIISNTLLLGIFVAGDQYMVIPAPAWPRVSSTPNAPATTGNFKFAVPYFTYLTLPFGIGDDKFTKKFNRVKILVRGSGILRFRTYVDAGDTVSQSLYLTIPSSTKMLQRFIHLNGVTGQSMRVEVAMLKGSGWFEIDELGVYWRRLGMLRNR